MSDVTFDQTKDLTAVKLATSGAIAGLAGGVVSG
jgi:hypothetical protein